jgi:hypothetical protein
MFEGLFQPVHLLILGFWFFVLVIPFWQIFKKAGFSPCLSVLMAIPFLNVVVLYFLGFASWPATKKAK